MPSEPRRVAGIVLAAGASRRMGGGTNKLLLELDGEPMVRRTVLRALQARLNPLVVVTGHQGESVRAVLAGLPCAFAESAEPTGPTSASLHAGLRALDEQTDAAVILLADMVRVSTAMMEQVSVAVATSPGGVVGSRYGESVFAPPLAFGRPLWRELLAFNGEGGGKAVLLAHLDQALILDWPAEMLRDVDTAADFEELSS